MQIVSTMGSGQLGREIDLSAIVEALSDEFSIECNFHSDSMVTVRLEQDGPAFTLYRTGTFQIRGTESSEDLFRARDRLIGALSDIGLDLEEVSFEQNNAVYLEDFETEIELETLAIHLGLENLEYEPEQFPGVIYRSPELETVMLIFNSGKAIISGTTQEQEAHKSSDHLRKELQALP